MMSTKYNLRLWYEPFQCEQVVCESGKPVREVLPGASVFFSSQSSSPILNAYIPRSLRKGAQVIWQSNLFEAINEMELKFIACLS